MKDPQIRKFIFSVSAVLTAVVIRKMWGDMDVLYPIIINVLIFILYITDETAA